MNIFDQIDNFLVSLLEVERKRLFERSTSPDPNPDSIFWQFQLQTYLDGWRDLCAKALQAVGESPVFGELDSRLNAARTAIVRLCEAKPISEREAAAKELDEATLAIRRVAIVMRQRKTAQPEAIADAMLSPKELAATNGLTGKADALRKRLERWREKHAADGGRDWIENSEATTREARFLYRTGAIQSIIDEMKNVQQTSSK